MISSANSEEFVPIGRKIVENHPGPYKELLLGDHYSANPVDKVKHDICGTVREHVTQCMEECSDESVRSQVGNILNKISMLTLAEKEDNEKEYWILRSPRNLYGTSPSNKSNVLKGHNSTTTFYGNSVNFRSSISNKSKSKNRCSIGSENLSKNSKFSPTSNEKSKKSRPICEPPKSKSTKFTTRLRDGYIEDELYLKKQTVVWSRKVVNTYGSVLEPLNKVICSFTCEDKILSTLWCTFRFKRPTYDVPFNEMDHEYYEKPCICIVSSQTIKVFSENGEDFESAVPFSIDSAWATDFGLLISKEIDGPLKSIVNGPKSILYSLAHPLEDLYPVVINRGSYTQILSNPNVKVIFTSESPSLCVLFDNDTKKHSVYRIRKCRPDERDFYEKSLGLNSSSTVNNSMKLKSRLCMWDSITGNASNILNSAGSINSYANFQGQSTQGSAVGMRSTSAFGTTASSCDFNQPNTFNIDKVISLDMSRSLLPIKQFPAICLDPVWLEPAAGGDNENAAASKVFISDDLAGQTYFCYISQSRLILMRANFATPSYSFGPLTSISAKDAVPIPHLHMMAILEQSGNVCLYSGMNLVGKLHLDGTLVKHTPAPYIRRFQAKLNSSFPRRSSLLPSSQQPHPEFDEKMFSPVLPSDSHNKFQISMQSPEIVSLIGLRDPLENSITLMYSDKTFYRVKFQFLATSPLVEHCLNALRQCLQRDAVMTFFTRWYSTRNSLGTQNCTDQQEWEMFTSLLFDLLGYEEEDNDTSKDEPQTPSFSAKKPKPSFTASDDDWEYLLNSEYNKLNSKPLNALLRFQDTEKPKPIDDAVKDIRINANSVLFPFIKLIHFSLHLMYEDFKLDTMLTNLLRPLAIFLNQISNDMSMFEFSLHYWKDFPDWCHVGPGNRRFFNSNKQVTVHNVNFEGVLNLMEYLSRMIQGESVPEFPYLKEVNERSRDVVQLRSILSSQIFKFDKQGPVIKPLNELSSDIPFNEKKCNSLEEVVLLMTQMKITTEVLDTLPYGLYIYFYDMLWKCRENPPTDWPTEAFLLIQREDLAYLSKIANEEIDIEPSPINNMISSVEMNVRKGPEPFIKDGMDDIDTDITDLIFPDDTRIEETRIMLQSSKPIEITIVQRPDISDHEFIEEQEKHLFAVSTRTMALPVGRGMFALGTTVPLMIQPLYTPQLCLTGRGAPRGTTIELSHVDAPSNMNVWPMFHNGVATGLTVSPNTNIIDNNWILFNKPKNTDKDMEYGGFLLAMGLHGHLQRLDVWNTYQHLSKKHEMITVGLLLGFASAHRGTSHISVTKMLTIHLEALFPPTSMELDLTHAPQVTSLLGVGLLYEGTGHSHMADVLLSEIGRPPGPEMENSTDRESYALAAGLGLGLVMLKKGSKLGSHDLSISLLLHYYMTGGIKRPFTGAQKDKYKIPSFQIKEGACVNLHVTSPGATLALGLMYMGSMNKTIADWMSPPETQYLLDFVRPDFLMLRVISRSLILWNDIIPSQDWIENQVPKNIRRYCMVQPSSSWGDIDYEAMNQAYCNIVTGACFALGLRYAGTSDERAFKAILHFCHMFVSLIGKSISELAGKTTIETCLNVLLISVSMVMAGTGNLEVMRLTRHLRRRVGVSSSAIVTYGSHLAIHMALGLLFLGGGKLTLSNSPSSIAALICAFYPKFPIHSNDNRYHLQAFRHLYVLAVEARLIIPRDLHSRKFCYANLKLVKLNGASYEMKAPATLPNLNTLLEVIIEDERYWKIMFKRDLNWKIFEDIVSLNGVIEVKQRAGCQEKLDNLGEFAKIPSQPNFVPWNPSPSTIKNFTSNQGLKQFCINFLESCDCSPREREIKISLTRVTYEATIQDKLFIVPGLASVIKMMHDDLTIPSHFQLWQYKLLLAHIKNSIEFNILQNPLLNSMKEEMQLKILSWQSSLNCDLQKYVGGRLQELSFQPSSKRIAAFVNFFNIPHHIDDFSHNNMAFLDPML